MKTRNFTENDILYAVATFNADPYCVEDDEMVAEIMKEIEGSGATMVTDEDKRKVALARLDLPTDSQRIVYQAGGCLFSMDGDKYLLIQDVLNEIRTKKTGVISIIAKEAYLYSSSDEQTWNGTLFTKKYANRRTGDEVIQTGNKETNVSEVERTLKYLVGKGKVQVRLKNMNWMCGDLKA